MLRPRIAIFDSSDQHFDNNDGRDVAVRLAAQLSASGHYQVIGRSECHRLLGGRELNQECRRHPAWAIYVGNLAGSDAVVIGCVCRAGHGQMTLVATMLDVNGFVLAKAAHATVDDLAQLLCGNRMARKIRGCDRPVRAMVTRVEGSLIILNAGTASGLKPGDRLRVERVLETVADPYFREQAEIVARLTVTIGHAQVMEAGPCATLAHYSGNQPGQAGDLAIRLES